MSASTVCISKGISPAQHNNVTDDGCAWHAEIPYQAGDALYRKGKLLTHMISLDMHVPNMTPLTVRF